MVIDDTGSVEDIYACIYCTKWRSGQVSRMPDSQTLKDRATQLLTKYKSGAFVTQLMIYKRYSKTASWVVVMSHWGKEMELVMDNNGRTMG